MSNKDDFNRRLAKIQQKRPAQLRPSVPERLPQPTPMDWSFLKNPHLLKVTLSGVLMLGATWMAHKSLSLAEDQVATFDAQHEGRIVYSSEVSPVRPTPRGATNLVGSPRGMAAMAME